MLKLSVVYQFAQNVRMFSKKNYIPYRFTHIPIPFPCRVLSKSCLLPLIQLSIICDKVNKLYKIVFLIELIVQKTINLCANVLF